MKAIIPFPQNLIVLSILLLTINPYNKSCLAIKPPTNTPTSNYITEACQTTLYPKLCDTTLSKFANTIKTNPKSLAMAALLVTINTTRSTSEVLTKLSRNRAVKLGEKAAVIECVEEVGDSLFELQKSMKELNHSRKGRPQFELQMNDVQTWVSAALTADDTCMDDFTTRGAMRILVRGLVLRIARLTSIALAFINNYGTV